MLYDAKMGFKKWRKRCVSLIYIAIEAVPESSGIVDVWFTLVEFRTIAHFIPLVSHVPQQKQESVSCSVKINTL